ncbi:MULTISPECIES: Hpt domain-containing protein [unclassified Colwellia]|jgi:HPt (histidine-containing phosphotransfer) domain-containing protein|uniref:Hpt domain-containing protein n=1 Tax=unclassified Colwellia TaxID=196834 RepID=UPI0015F4A9A6|nr:MULTISPECIES: Hpt domain-containing protein [unclassified Colwellia]MBA6252140.1 Hpt domain-containing protein [Colwellia sp. MB3u-55]MBA6399758.1 Hpt domain-containing protein [Colwellia sp. BRX10-4]
MIDSQRQILNRNVMRDLIGDDVALARKFEIEFLKQAKGSINKIALSYNSHNFTAIKEEAHYLKTSAKAVGAEQTAALLEALESMALDKNIAECKQKIVSINAALKQVYGAIVNES